MFAWFDRMLSSVVMLYSVVILSDAFNVVKFSQLMVALPARGVITSGESSEKEDGCLLEDGLQSIASEFCVFCFEFSSMRDSAPTYAVILMSSAPSMAGVFGHENDDKI